VKQKPKGVKDFQKWMKRGDFDQNENALVEGWSFRYSFQWLLPILRVRKSTQVRADVPALGGVVERSGHVRSFDP
jgi:hypothetical protein